MEALNQASMSMNMKADESDVRNPTQKLLRN